MDVHARIGAPTKRWELKPADESATSRIVCEVGLPRIVARTLVARGVDTPEAARLFMVPSLDRSWCDPLIIPGMAEVADMVERSLDAGERIAVFGDFDVDGVTATTVLTRALRALGGDVVPFLPQREAEGYGLSISALERLLEHDPKLVVTVDNGIAARDEAAWLVAQGVKLAVTDHHEAADLVPQGVPVCDPKLQDEGPSRELAGVGVALKLVYELGRRRGAPDLWRDLTDLACLGTVADLMPFTEENRAIVADGIARINERPRPGIAALSALVGASTAEMTAESLSFSLIPRINAAGRIDDPAIALKLLLTDSIDEASEAAAMLEEINTRRRAIEQELADMALEQAEQMYHGQHALVLAGEGWHEGVKGIVASRLVGKYGVPTILFSVHDGMARGSGRTVGSINLFKAVAECSDLLERFGGHEAAVGVTIKEENLEAFRERFTRIMDKLPARDFVTVHEVDASVKLSELTFENLASIQSLQPFGQGMRTPLFVSEGVYLSDCGIVGKDASHLRFTATDGINDVSAIRFRCPKIQEVCECEQAVDIVFEGQAEEWRGRRQAKMVVRDIEPSLPADMGEASGGGSVADRLIAKADEYLSRDVYAGIGDADYFHTKVAGVSFEGRQRIVASLAQGDALALVRDPENPYDPNALKVVSEQGQVGFLNRALAAKLSPLIDAGASYRAVVANVTGERVEKGEDPLYGLNIEVIRERPGDDTGTADAHETSASLRKAWSAYPPNELDERLKQAFIGDAAMHAAQREALANLGGGISTLAVMATGRGKSLIFHLHAARTALSAGKASVFVYPLRALVADQSVHLRDAMAQFGLGVAVLTGETPLDARDRVFSDLASGNVDIILTTPEFLAIHAGRFAEAGRIGFLAIDEAHHIAQQGSSKRSAYAELPRIRALLGEPVCLAVTATARHEDAARIDEMLGIGARVLDPTVRANLTIDDQRTGLRESGRDTYLASIVSSGEKTIIYANSRYGTVQLARTLRRRVPSIASQVAYYHGGLPKGLRAEIEAAFRSGEVSVLAATSAFGEGVNIPDVRHVVLYHLPFSDVEFNQMSGRAGRDGSPSTIHLLFSQNDMRINEGILSSSAPARSDLMALYRTIRRLSEEGLIEAVDHRGDGEYVSCGEPRAYEHVPRSLIVDECLRDDVRCRLDEDGVSCGLGVFEELGFVRLRGRGLARRISFVRNPERVDLGSSMRYQEGLEEMSEFNEYANWVFDAEASALLDRINRPILP